MLKEIALRNFGCFAEHELPFSKVSLIVGRNNAGKSTIVLALRFLSIALGRRKSLPLHEAPDWLDLPRRTRGIKPSLEGLEFKSDSLFHRYSEPPAIVTARFASGCGVDVYIGPDESMFAAFTDSSGHLVINRSGMAELELPAINALPQIGPVQREEEVLTPEYVRRMFSSTLAPSHFRNQLNLRYAEFFEEFKQLAESTWPGLSIRELENHGKTPKTANLGLMIRDGNFVAEVGRVGHGLQMWLQTLWFLVHSKQADVLILDEPDVYLHADLQRRLIGLLKKREQQVIVATHSIDIMAEVDPNQVLVVDKSRKRSGFATSLPAVQQVIDSIGGVHNIQLARLWSSRRCLLVEGKDIKLLRLLQSVLFPDADAPFDVLPHVALGGWSGWPYAIGSSMLLQNAGGEGIITYCIFDSDYHPAEELEERRQDARRRNIQIHIWKKKEIENYLVVPTAVQRLIAERAPQRTEPPSVEEVHDELMSLTEPMREEVFDAISTELLARNRGHGVSGANKNARKRVNDAFRTLGGRLGIVSGKTLLARLSEWSQREFGVSLTAEKVARVIRLDELDDEIKSVISAIEKEELFGSHNRP